MHMFSFVHLFKFLPLFLPCSVFDSNFMIARIALSLVSCAELICRKMFSQYTYGWCAETCDHHRPSVFFGGLGSVVRRIQF